MKYNINLLSKPDAGIFDNVLYFFLNYLRYVLVITQLVVIGVLFFRFRIDQNIIDLKEALAQKEEIVKVVAPLLLEADRIDRQIRGSGQVLSNQETLSGQVSYLLSVFPQNLTLSQFVVSEGVMELGGAAVSPRDLQLFYQKLQQDKRFGKVELGDIKREELGYTFSLTLEEFH